MKNKRKNVVRRITALMLACGILFTAPWAVTQDSGVATYTVELTHVVRETD